MADAPKTDSPRLPPGLIVLLAVVFVNMVGFGVVVPLLPFFAKSLNAEPWQIEAHHVGKVIRLGDETLDSVAGGRRVHRRSLIPVLAIEGSPFVHASTLAGRRRL